MTSSKTGRRPNGVTLILAATAVSGGCGYLVTMIVGANKTPAGYVGFSVFWATLYLVIAALSGLQQEITRGTRPRSAPAERLRPGPAAVFGFWMSLVTAAVILATAPAWAAAVFGGGAGTSGSASASGGGWALVIPLAVGAASYVVVAVICGTMYGLSLWRAIALMIGIDGILRLIAVVVVLLFTQETVALAWAVVVPFPLTPLVLWFFVRRGIVGFSELDVGYRRLAWNVARTIVAAAATGILVSGYPLVLKAMSPHAPEADLGAVLFSITLIRAPLIIVFLALQSYLVVHFRTMLGRTWRLFGRLVALVVGVTIVLAAVAWLIGPPILGWFGAGYAIDGTVLAALVGTSGLLAILCVSGPFVLARSQHGIFTTGWLVAAAASILALLIPGDLATRMLVSLTIGALVGIATHVIGAAVLRRAS